MDNPILYIIRGASGSGKTTLATVLSDNAVAADDFMVDASGRYFFDPRSLPIVHQKCELAVRRYMERGVSTIAVHNTFTQRWQWKPYLNLAAEHGYAVHVLECQNDYGNLHDCPTATVRDQRRVMERPDYS